MSKKPSLAAYTSASIGVPSSRRNVVSSLMAPAARMTDDPGWFSAPNSTGAIRPLVRLPSVKRWLIA